MSKSGKTQKNLYKIISLLFHCSFQISISFFKLILVAHKLFYRQVYLKLGMNDCSGSQTRNHFPLDWNSPYRGEGASTKKFLPEYVNEKSSTERRS